MKLFFVQYILTARKLSPINLRRNHRGEMVVLAKDQDHAEYLAKDAVKHLLEDLGEDPISVFSCFEVPMKTTAQVLYRNCRSDL